MPHLGDVASRPEGVFVVVMAMPWMHAESDLLSTNAMVAWFEDGRKHVPCNEVVAAFATTFGCRKADVTAFQHLPEQFFVRLEAHADNKDMMHHVWLCIEGIPIHGWNKYVAAFVIGRKCSIDYIEPLVLRRKDTLFLSLWAWTSDPNATLKVKRLSLPARGHHRHGRRGLRHGVLLHLDVLKDYYKARDDDDDPPPNVEEFTWYPR
ncbi:hypothetical protein D1007_48368 [Hordeum vulgare]|nr:hypothetical protein D1007_48368 [Hordeum vulgare]